MASPRLLARPVPALRRHAAGVLSAALVGGVIALASPSAGLAQPTVATTNVWPGLLVQEAAGWRATYCEANRSPDQMSDRGGIDCADPGAPRFEQASIENGAVRLGLLSGGPRYGGVLYRNDQGRDPNATQLELEFVWSYTPTTTFDNNHCNCPPWSRIQNVQFGANRWASDGLRYELAAQWMNVTDGSGSRAPTWRIWDGQAGKWIDLGIRQRLPNDIPHSLRLRGEIVDRKVHYTWFESDGEGGPLDQWFDAPAHGYQSRDEVTATVQLDGNHFADEYQVYLHQFALHRR